MTLTHRDIRETIATAAIDDLHHGQDGLELRPLDRETGRVYEVRGTINPATLGAFAAAQLVNVLNRRHPGLLDYLNTGHAAEVTAEEISSILDRPHEADPAAAIAELIHERHAHRPTFDQI